MPYLSRKLFENRRQKFHKVTKFSHHKYSDKYINDETDDEDEYEEDEDEEGY